MQAFRRALLLAGLASLVSLRGEAQTAKPTAAALAAELKAGGHVIVMRHGGTHPDQADLDPLNPEGSGPQRQLNDKGREAAKVFGAALKAIGVPVTRTITSRFNRAHETAVLAGLPNIEKSTDVSEGGLVVSPNENARRAAALKKLVETPLTGTLVIVSHKPNIMDALGKDWFDVREGEASIFRPGSGSGSGGPVLVARLRIEEWPSIAAAVGK